ncbi:MAG TPA: cob(I)yrinic acid a,c-diamide adenosyltransferase [bacterium]|nr:cob(I)yrinic acid a,c-diamide adenosyltransferase [bacterium]
MNESKKDRRMIHVYSGPGKGKTTAALGLALRACGHGWRVRMICFMKGDPNYGEVIVSGSIPNFELIQSGLPAFVKKGEPSDEDLRLARKGFELAKKTARDNDVDMLILDEINVAVDYGLIPLEEVVEYIKNKPVNMELVLTGRYAHLQIVKLADLATEMLEIKHPFQQGMQSREGIDY